MTLRERFEAKFAPDPATGCWLWVACCFTRGLPYGEFWFEGKPNHAHRVAWIIFRGSIPNGLCVLHRCDVPQCVNPSHLFLGTGADNARDCKAKNRQAKGAHHGRAKLTEEQVREIRTDGRTSPAISADYGVASCTIRQIKSYRVWRHVD